MNKVAQKLRIARYLRDESADLLPYHGEKRCDEPIGCIHKMPFQIGTNGICPPVKDGLQIRGNEARIGADQV